MKRGQCWPRGDQTNGRANGKSNPHGSALTQGLTQGKAYFDLTGRTLVACGLWAVGAHFAKVDARACMECAQGADDRDDF